jgi:hypothetical protein
MKDRDEDKFNKPAAKTQHRRRWESPALKTVGAIGEVLRQGGAKGSDVTGDPGEPRKVQPQG